MEGPDAAARFDGLGRRSGRMAWWRRAMQQLAMDQMPDFLWYEEALRHGRRVVAVHAPNADLRSKAVAALQLGQGHTSSTTSGAGRRRPSRRGVARNPTSRKSCAADRYRSGGRTKRALTRTQSVTGRSSAAWRLTFRAAYAFIRLLDPLFRWTWFSVGIGITSKLTVRGRRTGRDRSVLVGLLRVGGEWYVGHPNGEVAWTANLRRAGWARIAPRPETVLEWLPCRWGRVLNATR